MKYDVIAGKYKVSKVGIGGHYSKMEEGRFEYNYAEVTKEEIKLRTELIEKAVDAGINYFDTTWRNESDMLAESIRPLGIRDKIFINGMVLGTFRGSKEYDMTPSEYMNKWLDDRLVKMQGSRFDSFMINAIDENYNETECEAVIRTLETRKRNGDINVIGFSCHNHDLARKISDKFPQFELIMTAYNFKNRSFERFLGGAAGNISGAADHESAGAKVTSGAADHESASKKVTSGADLGKVPSFVAMKPLIWYEYGVPFCRFNELPEEEASKLLGIAKVPDIASKAVQWVLKNNSITTCVCAVNNMAELDSLIEAGNKDLNNEGEAKLEAYRNAIEAENHIPYLISAVLRSQGNRRSFFFGLASLAHAMGMNFSKPNLNDENSDRKLMEFKEKILEELIKRGYGKYI